MERRFPAYLLAMAVAVFYSIAGIVQSQVPANSGTSAQPQPSPAPGSQPAAGLKKRIAVIKFDAGGVAAPPGGVDLGSGLAAQLTTALINTGEFIVIERAELASVLREQEMSMQKLISGETAAQAGRLLGAQYLVRASVTEFEQQAGGGGIRLGIGGAGGGGGLGVVTNTGLVGVDLRLIDTTSGQVVQSHHAQAKVEDHGVSADVGVRGVSFGGDSFAKTPLGRATQQAINEVVAFTVTTLRPLAWTGRIVDVAGDQIFVNVGSSAGVRRGDTFIVSTVVKQLTDPASGAVLGVVEERLGEIEILTVQEQYSIAHPVTPFQTTRGDLVRATPR